MNRAKHFRAYTLDEETETPPQPSDVALTHTADSTREDDVGMYELIRRHRGLREITEGQSRNFSFSTSSNSPSPRSRDPVERSELRDRPCRTRVLAEFKQLAVWRSRPTLLNSQAGRADGPSKGQRRVAHPRRSSTSRSGTVVDEIGGIPSPILGAREVPAARAISRR